jgi:hypothetical protein
VALGQPGILAQQVGQRGPLERTGGLPPAGAGP